MAHAHAQAEADASNILLNPLPELRSALHSTSFGIQSYEIDERSAFPLTPADIESVRLESSRSGTSSARVVARAVMVLKGEGSVGIRLDRSGWTIESISSADGEISTKQGRTYESLETLLIDLSPAYNRAMNEEIWKRFGLSQDRDGKQSEEFVEDLDRGSRQKS